MSITHEFANFIFIIMYYISFFSLAYVLVHFIPKYGDCGNFDFLFFQIHFGESSMQKCEIMLNDLRHSKRTNSNIKDDLAQSSQKGTC